jgi:hypothetical protein
VSHHMPLALIVVIFYGAFSNFSYIESNGRMINGGLI